MNDPLRQLQRWYRSHCDGDWEHQFGIRLSTLDNPGWKLEIDLSDTTLAGRELEPIEQHRDEHDWLVCRIESETFRAYCGPENLSEVLVTFIEWSEVPDR